LKYIETMLEHLALLGVIHMLIKQGENVIVVSALERMPAV